MIVQALYFGVKAGKRSSARSCANLGKLRAETKNRTRVVARNSASIVGLSECD